MNAREFDEHSKRLATPRSRRQALAGIGAFLAGLAAVDHRTGLSHQPDNDGTPIVLPNTEPIFPTLDPIALGGNNYIVNGEITFIDPDIAAELNDAPAVPITLADQETLYVNLDIPAAIAGTPMAADDFATPSASDLQSVCGLNDSTDIWAFRGNRAVSSDFVAVNARPVGDLQWNSVRELRARYDDPGFVGSYRWCTGTLISENLFLTAAHCFNQDPPGILVPKINGTSDPIPRAEIATNMHVNFGWELDEDGIPLLGENFQVVELVEDRPGGLDFAIVRLEGTPGLTYGAAVIADSDSPLNSPLCIIGHPLGMPKRVDTGFTFAFQADQIRYGDLNTNSGSSGSGVLLPPPDGGVRGLLVGVHTNGGCQQTGFNYGVRISSLLRHSETLRSLMGKR